MLHSCFDRAQFLQLLEQNEVLLLLASISARKDRKACQRDVHTHENRLYGGRQGNFIGKFRKSKLTFLA